MLSNLRGLTFDDVLLVPGYNGIKSRKNVTTSVEVAGVIFEIPLISSNMDTITESAMADAMTDLGGMAVLHRFMSVEINVSVFKKLKHPHRTAISIGLSKVELE